MTLTKNRSFLLFFALAAAICALELWVARSPQFLSAPDILSLVVTVDLTVGLPLLFYWLVVRRFRLSALTVAPVFLLSVVVAEYALPPNGHSYLEIVQIGAIVAELALFGYMLLRARAVFVAYRQLRPRSVYGADALEASMAQIFGSFRAVKLILIELMLTYLAIAG